VRAGDRAIEERGGSEVRADSKERERGQERESQTHPTLQKLLRSTPPGQVNPLLQALLQFLPHHLVIY